MIQNLPQTQPTAAQTGPVVKVVPARSRLDSVDLLRGVVMVLMTLDHVRDFFTNFTYDPVDLAHTTPGYFLTRWVTHYCAPTFVFLAGTGAFLAGSRGKSKGQLAWFLFSRGLWLAFLELTWVRVAWSFNFRFYEEGVGVLWAIGWSMVALSGLVFLPVSAVTVIGVVMIISHNLFDKVLGADMGAWGWLWQILHTGEPLAWKDIAPAQSGVWAGLMQVLQSLNLPLQDFRFGPGYPLVPWIGVMAAGYGLGALLLLERATRRRELFGLGISLTAAFVVLRYFNLYGDRLPWSVQDRGPLFTVFSFLHCHKYPPSLMYLLMTLGPAITALAVFDRPPGPVSRFFLVFGRVPLFFYLLHLPLIHALTLGWAYHAHGGQVPGWLYDFPNPQGDGVDLPVVYLIWVGVVLLLWPVCHWYAGVKRRHPNGLLSYL
jgi:uncharacterized membrane protein